METTDNNSLDFLFPSWLEALAFIFGQEPSALLLKRFRDVM